MVAKNPSASIGSFISLPRSRAAPNPSPISTPFTAPIPIIAPAMAASSLPKRPGRRDPPGPRGNHLAYPPMVALAFSAARISASIASGSVAP